MALWLNGWSSPIVVSAGTPTYGRMWSMSKPVAVIATYRAAQRQGESLDTSLVTAATDAITRSDNCGERRIILGLQQLTGGLAPALSAFDEVLEQAGDREDRTPERATLAEPTCLAYFRLRAPTDIPNAEAWEFGTDEWTVGQAAGFAHALADGVYGSAGRFALTLMAMPKQPPLTSIEGSSGTTSRTCSGVPARRLRPGTPLTSRDGEDHSRATSSPVRSWCSRAQIPQLPLRRRSIRPRSRRPTTLEQRLDPWRWKQCLTESEKRWCRWAC